MNFQETSLKDAYIIEVTPFKDERGFFGRTYCKNEFARIGHTKELVQINHSFSKDKGTLRGMHFQHFPSAENKLVRCIHGALVDVIVDLRKDSTTFLQHIMVELSAENMQMLYVPEGFAHGFQTLTDDCHMLYHHTAYYDKSSEGGVRYNDPALNIQWPLTPTVTSEKDQLYPLINETFEGIRIS